MESLAFLGSTFRTAMQAPSKTTDVELGKQVIDRSVFAFMCVLLFVCVFVLQLSNCGWFYTREVEVFCCVTMY